jgi:rhodanese-related sulfurtransferase
MLGARAVTIMRLLSILALVIWLQGCSPPPYTNVGNEGLKGLVDEGVTLIDIRRPEEWRETGIVAGSRGLTFVDEIGRVTPGFLERLTAGIRPDEPVALICRTGNRTDVLARHMMEHLGYTQVYNVRDGIMGWIGAGLPVSRVLPPDAG